MDFVADSVPVLSVCEIVKDFAGGFNGFLERTLEVGEVDFLAALDDNLVAFGKRDGQVQVWDCGSGLWLWTSLKHVHSLTNMTTLRRKKFASTDKSKATYVWDGATGACLVEIAGCYLYGVAIAPLSDTRFATNSGSNIDIWDFEQKCVQGTLFGHTEAVVLLAAVGEEERLASSSTDQTMRVWDTSTRECLFSVPEFARMIARLEGSLFAVAAGSGFAVWDGSTLLQRMQFANPGYETSIVFVKPGVLAAGFTDGSIVEWDFENNKATTHIAETTNCVASLFCGDGRHLVSLNGIARVWDLSKASYRLLSAKDDFYLLGGLPNGTVVAVNLDGTVDVWK